MGRDPYEYESGLKICELIESMMPSLSPLIPKPFGDYQFDVGSDGSLNVLWNGYNTPQDIAAVHVASAASGSREDGVVQILCNNRLLSTLQRMSYVWSLPHAQAHCAFSLANEGKRTTLTRFANLGEDRPQVWDLSAGNPEFPGIGVSSKKTSYQRITSWVDIGEFDCSGDESWDDLEGGL